LTKIFNAIYSKTKKTEGEITVRAVHYRIDDFKKKSKIVSRRLAENAYAYEIMDIDVENFINSDEQKELQEWLSKKTPETTPTSRGKKQIKKPSVIRKKVAETFGLPENLTREASRMADIYPDIYYIENLIRHVVMDTLERKHGKGWWNEPNVVSNKIKEYVEGRKNLERKNRWHPKRRIHEIFYTDFRDLSRIIATNCTEFKKIFADMEIEAELRKLEPLRNTIAHSNPLPQKECNRIKIFLDDLKKQLNIPFEK
jgi:hypothetical protein